MAFTKLAAEIWRNFKSALNPLSGPYNPSKDDIRAWGTEVETQLADLFGASGLDPTVGPRLTAVETLSKTFNPASVMAGKAYAHAVTDKNGYALSFTYVDEGASLAGAAYAHAVTDADGYAVSFTYAGDGMPLPGRAFLRATLDADGYAIDVQRTDGRDYRPLPSFGTGLLHIICYGQSLSRGLRGELVTTAAVGRCYKFVGGVRADDGGSDPATTHASLVALTETMNGAGEGETPCGGLVVGLSQFMSAAGTSLTVQGQYLLASAAGLSGASIAQISKGTAPFETRLTPDLTYGPARAQALGLTYSAPVIVYAQGETDYILGTLADDYRAALMQLRADADAVYHAAVDTNERVLLISYQVGTHDYYGVAPTMALVQAELGTTNPDFACATPMYIMEYQDDVHLHGAGYKRLGAYFAKAIAAYQSGSRWLPVHPLRLRALGTVVEITMHVPVPPLALDTSLITNPNGAYGFEIFDPATGANLPISSVSIVRGDTVRLVLASAPPAGARARYAYTPPAGYVAFGTSGGNAGATPYGRNVGARGCLRDSDPTIFDPSGLNIPLQNYCVIFDMEIS